MLDLVPTPTAAAPDILRCAYMDLVVTDLAASREFYVDVLGLVDDLPVRVVLRVAVQAFGSSPTSHPCC